MLHPEVVDHYVGMAFGRECLHKLADGSEVSEPEAGWRLWLVYVSTHPPTGSDGSMTCQSIESASTTVELRKELYNG